MFRKLVFSFAILGLVLLPSLKLEEGMFPLNYLNQNQLQNAGLKLQLSEIYNPGNIALTDALVKVGGCTGSFISNEGLIITNHHCVYGDVSEMSTKENDLLTNGFVANEREKELKTNIICRITQSYEDVSSLVLDGVAAGIEPSKRAEIIRTNIKKIIETEKNKNKDLSYEVSEMFVGKSYILFRYAMLRDVRLVLAPPAGIGQFGGDSDNWEWPRHGGDFSLLRAYVSPEGKTATYNEKNIPFKPKKYLKINPNGSKENDFVFIMGYPGRTFRHETAPFMQFEQDIKLPETQSFYKWCIDKMYDLSKNNQGKFLRFAGEIQSLENVEKNYRGKLQGLRRTGLVSKKWDEEKQMQEFIASKNGNKELLQNIKNIWDIKTKISNKKYILNWLGGFSNHIAAVATVYNNSDAFAAAKTKKDKDSIAKKTVKELNSLDKVIDVQYDKEILIKLYEKMTDGFPELLQLKGKKITLMHWKKAIDSDPFCNPNTLNNLKEKNTEKLFSQKSFFMQWYKEHIDKMAEIEKQWSQADLQLRSIMPQYLDYKSEFKASQFMPDANSTLRLTYGYIKRFSPNDGEEHLPFTTIKGVWEKLGSKKDYEIPIPISDKLRVANVPDFFKDKNTGEVIVNFLYNLDTTGGNSGSPVMDAEGNLIGVNFDRSFPATINDYAWNKDYSRSIGCDIRYVIYIMKYVSKADKILEEINVKI